MIKRVAVPKDRLPIIIGKSGLVKKEIETKTQTQIEVDEDITIKGEGVGILEAENIVKAISRGFTPKQAMQLLEEDRTLYIIQLPKERKSLIRIRARLIGKNGQAKKNIERLTRSGIAVQGKTVSIIGTYENAGYAMGAIERLMRGDRHATVYKYLEDLNARDKID
ncbi:MAG: RNA-processing protein [Candidatus Aenigmarchaeota archaeon]|nr:RNA-processing protein [Candidatus Aenigmarchaeota archaeon]